VAPVDYFKKSNLRVTSQIDILRTIRDKLH
jgi:hypothetical protein